MVEKAEEFFSSNAGKALIADLMEMQNSHNNLNGVMNEAQSAANPELVISKHQGIVHGLENALQHIQSVRNGEVS